MTLEYILSSSEDKDFEDVIYRPKIIRRRLSYLEEFDNVDFHVRFRLSKESIFAVLIDIEQEISHKTEQFYATGSHLLSAADFSGVSKTNSHRIIHRVTAAIARLRPRYIKFPVLAEEIKREQIKFLI